MTMLGLRVDVDTLWGLTRGVRNLLDLFDEFGVKATFFVPMGPDRTGKTIKRILREKGFFQRLVRLQFGMRSPHSAIHLPYSAFYGTLLPSPQMGESHPEILHEIDRRGHEVGLHGYDHEHWRDDLLKMGEREIGDELEKATDDYKKVFHRSPLSSAAPGWRCTEKSLKIQERYTFQYASDTRGNSPFFPIVQISHPLCGFPKSQMPNKFQFQTSNFQMNDQFPETNFQVLKTLQLPVTLPTLDELIPLGKERNLLNPLNPLMNYHLFCAHAEVEGGPMISPFRDFLKRVRDTGTNCILPLQKIAQDYLTRREELPKCRIQWMRIPGRTLEVAYQMKNDQ